METTILLNYCFQPRVEHVMNGNQDVLNNGSVHGLVERPYRHQ